MSRMTQDASTQPPDASAQPPDASQPFVGRWYQLVSNTNWEKGRIIHEWRAAMVAAGGPAAEYADEAWGQRVGGISGQHVGRLRRVFDRFGAVCPQYEGLYWSHFQAALDWDDAEMWLEVALHNEWSVSQMRRTRWETLAAVHDQQPPEDDAVAELDEDFQPPADDVPPTASGETQVSPPTTNSRNLPGRTRPPHPQSPRRRPRKTRRRTRSSSRPR